MTFEYLSLVIPGHEVVHIIEIHYSQTGTGRIPMCSASNLAAWHLEHVQREPVPTCLACISKTATRGVT